MPPGLPAAPSEACRAFLASMAVGYEQWHDGIGYDLDALKRATPQERRYLVALLGRRIGSGQGGWREVEALDAADVPEARALLEEALARGTLEVRLHAARIAKARGAPVPIDRIVAEVLRGGAWEDGLSLALDLAATCATPYLRNVLLGCALDGPPDVRVHAAALCLYLAGKAEAPFDWKQRPFLLQFGEDDRHTREQAFAELCRRIGAERGRWPDPPA